MTHKIENKIESYRVVGQETIQEEVILDTVLLPNDLPARMKTLRWEGKKWYLTTVYLDGDHTQPIALFCQTNCTEKTVTTSDAVERLTLLAKQKGIPKEHIDSTNEKLAKCNNVDKLTRVIGLLLRHGVLVKNIVACLDQMDDVFVGSFLFHLKKFLSVYIKNGSVVENEKCKECGGALHFSEGCMACISCGNSKCG